MKITLKLNYEGAIRRLSLESSPPTMEEVRQVVRDLFQMEGNYILSYIDEEGDKILVSSDVELKEALSLASSPGMLRLDLEKAKENEEDIALFNKSPEKGVKNFISRGVVSESPESVAMFLKNCEKLDKKAVGTYLGTNNPFPSQVRHHYISSFNFSPDTFIEALRRLLLSFCLPGEAQLIDSILETFGDVFLQQSSHGGIFKDKNAVYVFAYATIMLTTDLHHPKIKDKMSFNDFERNNRGINQGEDLPKDFLEGVYQSILENGIKLKED